MGARNCTSRRRIGQVSIYEHHGSWCTYHRVEGKAVRRFVGPNRAEAELTASLLNAQLLRESAKLDVDPTWAAALGLGGGVSCVQVGSKHADA
jgi:hypothetical protein